MFRSIVKFLFLIISSIFFLCLLPDDANALSFSRFAGQSVVKIYATFQREDYSTPWQGGRPLSGTGTGFIINKRRILTNAHVVSDARFIHVQKDGDPRRFRAKVKFVGHDCDLAVLTVEDSSFFDGTSAIKFAKVLPKLNDEVIVLGYPMGGTRISITRGVVSRIDYGLYSHSGSDQHLVLQVDAAINPGNSGGPIIFKNKAVGLAFQGLIWADNIGYAVPVPVIHHFLEDIKDGKYNRYPELGVAYLDTRNNALRKDLKLSKNQTGVVIYHVDPFGSARNYLYPRDILLAIDGCSIKNDGTIQLGDNNIIFLELLERKQWGDSIKLDLWRDGSEKSVKIPLTNIDDPFMYRNVYDKRPEYYINGGLVFSPLTRGYLQTLRKNSANKNTYQLFYYSYYAKIDNLYKGVDEFVVLIRRLPNPVNTYATGFINGIVTNVNNTSIHNLKDIKNAMDHPIGGFHVVRFAGMDDYLVLDAKATDKANKNILKEYGIVSNEYFSKDHE